MSLSKKPVTPTTAFKTQERDRGRGILEVYRARLDLRGELAAVRAQLLEERAHDPTASTARIICTVEVVLGHDRVHGRRDLGGREPVVAALAGEKRAGERVVDAAAVEECREAPGSPSRQGGRAPRQRERAGKAEQLIDAPKLFDERVAGREVPLEGSALIG